ncbi:winged helix-turn-helix transcriptional regulator [Nocardia sp. NPDC050799]|uniref:winged helix-turn-helix transcriptional regulator n=1 Tax=Nocardia sp. NPDC050799 TaxID=3154842 RepID=UPI0033E099E6
MYSGPRRLSELPRAVPGLSRRMLTVSTRNPLRDGLTSRRMYPGRTTSGRTLPVATGRKPRGGGEPPSPTGHARTTRISCAAGKNSTPGVPDPSRVHRDLGTTRCGFR